MYCKKIKTMFWIKIIVVGIVDSMGSFSVYLILKNVVTVNRETCNL